MEAASTITLNSFNSLATINGNDMYPIFNFGGNINVKSVRYKIVLYIYVELRQEHEEKELDVHAYVQIIKDALNLNKSICLARNFHQLHKDDVETNRRKVFVDIWPVCTANRFFIGFSRRTDYLFQERTIPYELFSSSSVFI
jgi:hypothetical protein